MTTPITPRYSNFRETANGKDKQANKIDEHKLELEHRHLTLTLLAVQERFAGLINDDAIRLGTPTTGSYTNESERQLSIIMSQLMHAQAVIEGYHNLCTDIIAIMSKTEQSMDRAHNLIEKLVNSDSPKQTHQTVSNVA